VGQFRVNASAIAEQLLGPKYSFAHDMAICKPPGSTAETPWHQDFAYHDPRFDMEGLMFWVPLQPVTPENGCLRFIPGSHLSDEVLPHHPINNDPRSRGLECDSVDVNKAILAPLPLGGASIHHARTLHSAGPNKTPSARRAYILEFRLPPQRRAVPRNCYWQPSRKSSFATRAGSLGALVRNTLFLAKKRIRARIKPQR
jgi:ectoine hydroxylase-related dioxygenase (phytanoyl-CoA dioxygenase family)